MQISENFIKRIAAMVVLLPPVVYVIYAGSYWFSGLVALGGFAMILEWCKLTNIQGIFNKATAVSSVFFVIFLAMTSENVSTAFILSSLYLELGFFTLIYNKIRKKQAVGEEATTMWWFAGCGYVSLPLASLIWLRSAEDGFLIVMWIFLVVWATDIGGYIFGKTIGGPKLAPKVSPKKTWAGLIGGMVLSAIVSAILVQLSGWWSLTPAIIFAAVLAVVAQIGDLSESAIKRFFNVKDSGGLIPGHGGVLDRVDGIVFAAPVVALTYYALNYSFQ